MDQVRELKEKGDKEFAGDWALLRKGFPRFNFELNDSEMARLINRACKYQHIYEK